MIVFGQSGCIQAKWLHKIKVVVIEEKLFYLGKVLVFE